MTALRPACVHGPAGPQSLGRRCNLEEFHEAPFLLQLHATAIFSAHHGADGIAGSSSSATTTLPVFPVAPVTMILALIMIVSF
jgi:hypothetical protein